MFFHLQINVFNIYEVDYTNRGRFTHVQYVRLDNSLTKENPTDRKMSDSNATFYGVWVLFTRNSRYCYSAS